jgi:transcriptional regulator NrdR family protein
MSTIPLDGSCQAEYADGFILDETEHDDISPYHEKNIFDAILNKLPEAEHGKMVRFTTFWKNHQYTDDNSKNIQEVKELR